MKLLYVTIGSLIKMSLMFMLLVIASTSHAHERRHSELGIAVKFYGTGNAGVISDQVKAVMMDTNIDVAGFDCFQLPILDPATLKAKGIGIDCLKPISTIGDVRGEGLQMEAYTFFFLKNGTIVNHGCTSVRPFFEGVGDTGVTHLTGSIGPSEFNAKPNPNGPKECKNNQGVVYTSGAFKYMTGEARLSGAVNLSNVANGQISFSCLFIIRLDKDYSKL